MALTLIRRQLIRTYESNGNDVNDVNQLTGEALLLVSGEVPVISDIKTADSATLGANLIGTNNSSNQLKGTGGTLTVQQALEQILKSAQCVGAFTSVSNLNSTEPASADNNGMLAIVYNTGNHLEDGIYESNGASWSLSNATLYRDGSANYALDDILDMKNNDILGLPATPGASTAATSKTYVDSLISGKKWADPVDYKTEYVYAANGNFPAASTVTDGAYAFATSEDSGQGVLYQESADAWVAVSGTALELLMLNGGSLSGTTNADYILEYSVADHWDYDNGGGTRHTPLVNETRIYKVDDNGYTYDSDNAEWVLTDSTGGTVGDRQYTEDNWLADNETVTQSLDKLDIELKDLYDAIGLGVNEDITNLDYGTENNVVAADSNVEVAITALDEKWGDLAASGTTGEGAALVGIEDTGAYFAGTTVETALQEVGAALAEDDVKGWFGYKQNAGTGGAGEVTFANLAATVTITPTQWSGISTFMNQTGDNTWGSNSTGVYDAITDFLAEGFNIQVEVDGTVQPPIYLAWTNATNTLVITLDGNLRANDFVTVKLTRNAYS